MSNQYYRDVIVPAAAALKRQLPARTPRVALVRGSGWDALIERVESPVRVSYADVPGMRLSTVQGHDGEWIFGRHGNNDLLIMNGRLHYYEGYSMRDVTLPIRIMKEMGVEILILTNAAGAINTDFNCGDLMLINDHINLSGNNALIGENIEEMGPRFPDMSKVYDRELLRLGHEVAREQGFAAREGVYAQMSGPSFETPAEIRMLRAMGADAVGMSTVPEATVARHMGLRVLGVSCMTNMAAGVLDQPLSHAEVLETARRVRGRFQDFVFGVIDRL